MEQQNNYKGLSPHLYTRLPRLLQRICKPIRTSHEKDLVLLASLVVLSNIIRVQGIYDHRRIFSNLFLFITAPASAGKGVLKWVYLLADEIQKYLTIRYQVQMMAYKESEDQSTAEKPVKETYYIPGNASITAMIRQLYNNGGYGVMLESEADTLNVAMKNDWGNYSEVFRKSFEFERISQLRKDEENSFEIDNPRLSVVITGTKNQLLEFIPSVENGLFSRFMFMEFPLIKQWKNVFEQTTDFYSHYKGIALELLEFYTSEQTYQNVTLSKTQQEAFHTMFSRYHQQYDALLGEDVIASIRRIGNMHFRICMLLTGIRQLEGSERKENVGCSDEDFEIANQIIVYLLEHLRNIYGYLPITKKATKHLNQKQLLLYEALEDTFKFADFTRIARELGIAFGTAENYLRLFKKSGLIESVEHGLYHKIKI